VIGKLILTVTLVSTVIGTNVADWNRTHVFNPNWTPHARFHDVTYLVVTTGFCAVGLWLLWRRSAEPDVGARVAALAPIFAWGSFFIAEMVPGVHFEDDVGQVPRVAGAPINILLAAVFCVASAVGYGLYRLVQGGAAAPPEGRST
jgi:hypothetical protein